MKHVDPLARVAMSNAAQHLVHNGHSHAQAAKLLGLPGAVLGELIREAEQRQPKRCQRSCIASAGIGVLCPYCDHVCRMLVQQHLEQLRDRFPFPTA